MSIKLAIGMAARASQQSRDTRVPKFGLAARDPKSSVIASTEAVASWPSPQELEKAKRLARNVVATSEQLETRLYAMSRFNSTAQLAHGNIDPSTGVLNLATDLRQHLCEALHAVGAQEKLAVGKGTFAPNPLLSSVVWSLSAVRRACAAVHTDGVEASASEHTVKDVLAMIDDLPSAHHFYSDVVRSCVPVHVRDLAFTTQPWVNLPTGLRSACIDRGTFLEVDASRGDPADLETLLLPKDVRAAFHELSEEVRTLLRAAHISHWPTGGTLLGAIRHQDIIPWDDDVDFCVCPDPGETTSAFEKRLRAAIGFPFRSECSPLFGYKVHSAASVTDESRKHCIFGVFVDLFVVHPFGEAITDEELHLHRNEVMADSGSMRNLRLAYEDGARTWPAEVWTVNEVSPPRPALFGPQRLFKVPHGAESYLDRMFGQSWRTTCVIPRSAHGRTMEKELRFPLSWWQRHSSPAGNS